MEKVVLMGAGEIRRRLGISRQRVQQIITRKDFPDPYQELEMGKVWDAVDVERWIATYRPQLNQEDGL
ncbi:helix-turn-helix transcriptional regulator [Paractinoplanes maris]|uniref:helix-turn-helix transcriptional regulator n=1 Tax=Paractinoplanes maris TaxID=1734446 RepID=UPI002020FCFD|nr:DNA-binding protein [Actinoplanes maris]